MWLNLAKLHYQVLWEPWIHNILSMNAHRTCHHGTFAWHSMYPFEDEAQCLPQPSYKSSCSQTFLSLVTTEMLWSQGSSQTGQHLLLFFSCPSFQLIRPNKRQLTSVFLTVAPHSEVASVPIKSLRKSRRKSLFMCQVSQPCPYRYRWPGLFGSLLSIKQ